MGWQRHRECCQLHSRAIAADVAVGECYGIIDINTRERRMSSRLLALPCRARIEMKFAQCTNLRSKDVMEASIIR